MMFVHWSFVQSRFSTVKIKSRIKLKSKFLSSFILARASKFTVFPPLLNISLGAAIFFLSEICTYVIAPDNVHWTLNPFTSCQF